MQFRAHYLAATQRIALGMSEACCIHTMSMSMPTYAFRHHYKVHSSLLSQLPDLSTSPGLAKIS